MAQHTTTLFVNGDKDEFDPDRWSAATSNNGAHGAHEAVNNGGNSNTDAYTTNSSLPKRHPDTGINVLIVGAGLAGLMFAIESWRKGHNVIQILERSESPIYSGEHMTTARNCQDLICSPAL